MVSILRWFWLSLGLILLSGQSALSLPVLLSNLTNEASNLPLDGQGLATTHIVKVATLTLATDHPQGYTLNISSGSVSKSGGTPIPFQVAIVNADSPVPNDADFHTASGNNYTFVTSQANTATKDLYIRYSPNALQDPGQYEASLLLSITDNL